MVVASSHFKKFLINVIALIFIRVCHISQESGLNREGHIPKFFFKKRIMMRGRGGGGNTLADLNTLLHPIKSQIPSSHLVPYFMSVL